MITDKLIYKTLLKSLLSEKGFIKSIEENVLKGQDISFEDAIKLATIEEKEDMVELCNSANNIRQFFCGKEVDLCTIMNAKSGRYTENCKFCAQSAYYTTNAKEYKLVSNEDALKLAKENEKEEVNRFSLVTSGRKQTGNNFEKILDMHMVDKINLAFQLRDLGVKSIPVNVLNPIKGTPLEKSLRQDEILKTIAIIRFVNPKACIRLAGGRNRIDEFEKNCFNAGANATITGNYLITSGNKIKDNKKMVSELNMEVRKNS